MADKGKKIKTSEKQYGWCEAEEGWLPMTECSGCIHHFFDDTSHTSYCRWEKPVKTIEKKPKKRCPLLKTRVRTNDQIGGVTVEFEEEPQECIEEKCAWWIETGCAIYHIAYLDIDALRKLVEGREEDGRQT